MYIICCTHTHSNIRLYYHRQFTTQISLRWAQGSHRWAAQTSGTWIRACRYYRGCQVGWETEAGTELKFTYADVIDHVPVKGLIQLSCAWSCFSQPDWDSRCVLNQLANFLSVCTMQGKCEVLQCNCIDSVLPGPFGRVAHSAFTVCLTLMWEGNQLMWSRTPPKPRPPALP